MSNETEVIPPAPGRLAGLLYLVIIGCGIFGEAVVRSALIVAGDAAATAANILASPGLFRAGFVADALMLLSDVAIAVLFYVIFRPLHRTLALVAAAFRLMQAALIGVSLLGYYGAFLLITSAGAAAVEAETARPLALWLLQLHGHGYDFGLIFFAVSCFALGRLILLAPAIPNLLGYGLLAAGGVYLLGSLTRFLLPELLPYVAPAYLVPLLAELAFCLWLLRRGAVVACRGG